jgi:hypothetical protein
VVIKAGRHPKPAARRAGPRRRSAPMRSTGPRSAAPACSRSQISTRCSTPSSRWRAGSMCAATAWGSSRTAAAWRFSRSTGCAPRGPAGRADARDDGQPRSRAAAALEPEKSGRSGRRRDGRALWPGARPRARRSRQRRRARDQLPERPGGRLRGGAGHRRGSQAAQASAADQLGRRDRRGGSEEAVRRAADRHLRDPAMRFWPSSTLPATGAIRRCCARCLRRFRRTSRRSPRPPRR